MHPQDDRSALPLRRDWTGWLFVLLVAVAIGVVLYVSRIDSPGTLAARPHPVAPPADVVPDVLPMELAPVTEDDARAANARIALVTKGFVAARPFVYAGSGDARLRARDCLAAAMIYEAGDDSRGQLSVGQVVINRARHPAFPKSICGVVFQGPERRTGCQFTFTCDGALARRYSEAAWIRAQVNADMMMSGLTDPSVGLATHYHTDWVRPLLERQPREDRDRRHPSLLPLAGLIGARRARFAVRCRAMMARWPSSLRCRRSTR